MKNLRILILGIILTIVLILLMYWVAVMLGINRYAYIGVTVILLGIGIFLSVYIQKLQKPVCESCGKELKLINKEKIDQTEEIINGRFVFIYRYNYQYQCSDCKKEHTFNKTIKSK